MVSENDIILGSATVRKNMNRVMLPPVLGASGVVQGGEPVFWTIDPEETEVVISQDGSGLRKDERVAVIDQSTVTDQSVTMIPKIFFADYDSPYTLEKQGLTADNAVFDYGEPVFFMASKTERESGMCR